MQIFIYSGESNYYVLSDDRSPIQSMHQVGELFPAPKEWCVIRTSQLASSISIFGTTEWL